MKVLVVGGGGREHVIAWKLARGRTTTEIISAPGNAGLAGIGPCYPVPADDLDALVALAREQEVGLVVVGPELPLTLGLVDRLGEEGIPAFGPTAAAARLEGSKWFAKEIMREAGVPTADARLAESREQAHAVLDEIGVPIVIKADGLAAGKGVVVATSLTEARQAIDDAMERERFGTAGSRVLLEELLEGEEVSILAFTDGTRIAPLVPSQDHKRAYDGDCGPNTGGMGAYAPAPVADPAALEQVQRDVLTPTVAALAARGVEYRGVLYAGLMMTDEGPKVVEFNCRFGDPEAQVVLPLLDGDLGEIMLAVARGELDPSVVRTAPGAAACVVLASGGYPGAYEKGKTITGIDEAARIEGVTVFHAGTASLDGETVTAGGRVLGVTGVAGTLQEALERAYSAARAVRFDGAEYRRDIGHRALARLDESA